MVPVTLTWSEVKAPMLPILLVIWKPATPSHVIAFSGLF